LFNLKTRPPAIALLAFLAAAPGLPQADVVWEDDESWVRIEGAEKGAPPNDHPADLTAADVQTLLGGLEVRRRKGEAPVPLFSLEELELITPYLATAFAEAGPGQDVYFRTRGGHSQSAFIGRKLFVTQGLMFMSEGRLNVIFNRLQEEARKRNFYGQRDEDFYSARPPSRKRETEFRNISLMQGDGAVLRLEGGSVRGDWVEIAAAPDALTAGRSAGDAGSSVAAGAAAGTAAARDEAEAGASPSSPPAADGDDYVPLEARLRQLKALRDEGLITEEVYQEKMRQLLREL
jgi:hypothetical protein